jgi:hypothetical protein
MVRSGPDKSIDKSISICALAALIGSGACTDDLSDLRDRQLLSGDTGTKTFNNAGKKHRTGWAHTLPCSSTTRHLAQVQDFEFLAITLTGIKWAMCRYGEVFFHLNMIPMNIAAIFRVQDLKRNPQTPSARLPSPRNAEAVCLWLSQSRAVLAQGRVGGWTQSGIAVVAGTSGA